jgi:hypothetical protein
MEVINGIRVHLLTPVERIELCPGLLLNVSEEGLYRIKLFRSVQYIGKIRVKVVQQAYAKN